MRLISHHTDDVDVTVRYSTTVTYARTNTNQARLATYQSEVT